MIAVLFLFRRLLLFLFRRYSDDDDDDASALQSIPSFSRIWHGQAKKFNIDGIDYTTTTTTAAPTFATTTTNFAEIRWQVGR